MRNARLTIGIVAVVTIVAMMAMLLLPRPAYTSPSAFYITAMLTAAVILLNAGAAVLFAMSLGSLKNQRSPKRSIISGIVMCVGLAMFGLAFVQIPWLLYFDRFTTLQHGVITLPFVIGVTIIYFGNRSLAQLLGIRTLAQRAWFVVVASAVLGICLSVLSGGSTLHLSVNTFFNAWGGLVTILISINLWQIGRVIGLAYISTFAWLFFASVINALTIGVINTALLVATGSQSWQAATFVVLLPTAVAGVFFLRAAYDSNCIAELTDTQERAVARNFFGKPLQARRSGGNLSVDIVIFAANLVSNPAQIDSVLDQVRMITASRAQPGQPLSDADAQTLKRAYLQIEEYLLQKEQLRPFTQQGLRQTVAQRLGLTANSGTFWDTLS